MGRADEERADAELEARKAEEAVDVGPQGTAASSSSGSSTDRPRGRGPDKAQRERHPIASTAVGESNINPPGHWRDFDVNRTVRALNISPNKVRERLLWKLHLRWWLAGKCQLDRVLAQAGLNEECRKLIPDIVDSCPHCLKWARPLPASVASVNVPSAFNEEVECDIMFHAD